MNRKVSVVTENPAPTKFPWTCVFTSWDNGRTLISIKGSSGGKKAIFRVQTNELVTAVQTHGDSFLNFFSASGNELLKGWLRAKGDGNEELFADWVLGEYDCYLETKGDYEVPYHGLYDVPSIAEIAIYEGVGALFPTA